MRSCAGSGVLGAKEQAAAAGTLVHEDLALPMRLIASGGRGWIGDRDPTH